jgi:hypothetical protein
MLAEHGNPFAKGSAISRKYKDNDSTQVFKTFGPNSNYRDELKPVVKITKDPSMECKFEEVPKYKPSLENDPRRYRGLIGKPTSSRSASRYESINSGGC